MIISISIISMLVRDDALTRLDDLCCASKHGPLWNGVFKRNNCVLSPTGNSAQIDDDHEDEDAVRGETVFAFVTVNLVVV